MDVDQTAAIVGDSSLLQAILELPAGADIHVQDGRAFVTVDGMPADAGFVDRLLAVLNRLIAVVRHQDRTPQPNADPAPSPGRP